MSTRPGPPSVIVHCDIPRCAFAIEVRGEDEPTAARRRARDAGCPLHRGVITPNHARALAAP